jgi:hypothetical protein
MNNHPLRICFFKEKTNPLHLLFSRIQAGLPKFGYIILKKIFSHNRLFFKQLQKQFGVTVHSQFIFGIIFY